jgi:hypothetical protein
MRRLVSVLLGATLLLGSATGVLGGGKPTTEPVPFPAEGIELPAGAFCDFDLFVEAIRNTELAKTFPPYEDGSYLQIVTGQLWIRVTRLGSDASVDLKISGPVRFIYYLDGSINVTFFGRSLPVQPGQFLVTSGRIVQLWHPDGSSELLPASGHDFDVCALIAPA